MLGDLTPDLMKGASKGSSPQVMRIAYGPNLHLGLELPSFLGTNSHHLYHYNPSEVVLLGAWVCTVPTTEIPRVERSLDEGVKKILYLHFGHILSI